MRLLRREGVALNSAVMLDGSTHSTGSSPRLPGRRPPEMGLRKTPLLTARPRGSPKAPLPLSWQSGTQTMANAASTDR